jgi:hypothetical protein
MDKHALPVWQASISLQMAPTLAQIVRSENLELRKVLVWSHPVNFVLITLHQKVVQILLLCASVMQVTRVVEDQSATFVWKESINHW